MDKEVQAVSLGVYEQVKWERDLAISQLASYGISLGENADVISRSAVLKHKTRMTEYDETGCSIHVYVVKAEDIENLPAVDSKYKHCGRWVWDENAIDWNIGAWVCSKCGSRNDNIHAGKPGEDISSTSNPYMWKGSNFCPNCGIPMGGDTNAPN